MITRYVVFDNQARQIIERILCEAREIWPDLDTDILRFSAGYAGFGRYAGRYIRHPRIIELSYNPSMGIARLARRGVTPIDSVEFAGVVVHEICHHAAHEIYGYKSGNAHCNPAWFRAINDVMDFYETNPGIDVNDWIQVWERLPHRYRARVSYPSFLPHQNHSWLKNRLDEILSMSDEIFRQTFLGERNLVCVFCKERFKAKRITAKYCSSRCRTAAHRARHSNVQGKSFD